MRCLYLNLNLNFNLQFNERGCTQGPKEYSRAYAVLMIFALSTKNRGGNSYAEFCNYGKM